jgi:hypothetical protein
MMSEQVRALIAVLVISSMALFYIRPLAVKLGYSKDFRVFLDRWYVVTSIAFLSGHYGIFLLFETIYLKFIKPAKQNDFVIVFVVVSLILPHLSLEIPGAFGIRHLGRMDWYRFLVLILATPYFFGLILSKGFRFFNYFSDKIVVLLVIYLMILDITRSPSVTDQFRVVFFGMIDTIIPYYVISRHVNNIENIKRVLFLLFIIIFVAASLSVVETLKHWHFYVSLEDSLGIDRSTNITAYKSRLNILRASGAYGAITMGYILSIGVMLSYFFIGKIKTLKVKSIFLILILGILASLSRGPWVGFVIALFILLFLERKIISYLVWGGIGIIALLVSPYSEKFISLLPGVGSDEGGTISYRQDLLVTSLEVIEENLWLGDGSFLANPKMQHLIQGEKIIDIVNTYLQVALEYGVVALGLYVLMLLLPIKKLYKLSKTYNHSSEERCLCNLFIAIMILTLVVIATVSSLGGGVITFIILVFISLISAYIKIITNSRMTTV